MMKKRWTVPLRILSLLLCLQAPACAEAWIAATETLAAAMPSAAFESGEPAGECRSIGLEGAMEIDLRAFLGGEVMDINDVWMLNANICIVLRTPPPRNSGSLEISFDHEIIILDMQNGSILSRTLIPTVDYYYSQRREDDVFCFFFTPEDAVRFDLAFTSIKATVAPDGTVDIDASFPGRLSAMPDGKMAIRETLDGSLYAVDAATGQEDLLLQGVPGMGLFWDECYDDDMIAEIEAQYPFPHENYDPVAEYIPFWDELPENWVDGTDGSLPFKPDKNSDIFTIRQFYVHRILDEHRFVYTVGSWEWMSGFGVYDLQTRTDHRITGRGYFMGMGGDLLFGSTLRADVNTYASSPHPKPVQELFEKNSGYAEWHVDYDLSPNGKWIAYTDAEDEDSVAGTLHMMDAKTGAIIRTYDIADISTYEHNVDFYDDTHLMLFVKSEKLGTARIFLFEVEG